MILILGGSCSGKGAYVKERFSLSLPSGEELSREELYKVPGVLNLERFIYRELKEGREVLNLPRELIKRNPSMVLTVQEVGCGVVPMDPFERTYRETVGRVSTLLARESSEVIRMMAGLPMRLKP